MLEKPDIPNDDIIYFLHNDFGLSITQLTFLPIGADRNTTVYRAVSQDQTPYFVKLRGGRFNPIAVTLPKYLSDLGIAQIIPPLPTITGALWTNLGQFKLILYPFIEGQDGYEVKMSNRHWREFGSALRRIHSADLPPELIKQIRREDFSPPWRKVVLDFLERIKVEVYHEAVAKECAAFMNSKREELGDLIERAERLHKRLGAQSPEFNLNHYDLHAGNIFIGEDETLYIVDWDDPIMAPKERDLMYIGGGLMGGWRPPQEEEALFYPAYGATEINPTTLSWYRYARIIEDIGITCQQLLLTEDGGQDRARSLHYLKTNFLPDNTIDVAYREDKSLS